MRKNSSALLLVLFILMLGSFMPARVYYNEIFRPQFHFSPERNWMGLPGGLVYYNGEYKMFYQYNPKGVEMGYSHWGHASSTDLIRWKPQPVALFPDNLSEDKDSCTILPGCVIVDKDNLLKQETGGGKTLVSFYTSHKCGQRIAFSTDAGKTWKKYLGNPVIPYNETDDARHPKVFWYQPSDQYVMLIYRVPEGDNRKKGFSIYTSKNLVNWEFSQHVPGFYESPDLVELRVNNRPDEARWVLLEGDGSYVIGTFDGKTYLPETIKMKSDYGQNYYGAQTWSNLPAKDNRVLQIASVTNGTWKGMPFNGQMTFPSELSLKKFNTGTFLIRQPAREIEMLHDKKFAWKNENLIPGINENIIKKVDGDCLHIKGTFNLKSCDSFGFMLRQDKKNTGSEVLYNVKRQTLSLLGQTIPVEPVDNKIILEILIDRSTIEVYVNNGRGVITAYFEPVASAKDYILYNTGGELLVENMEIYTLKSAWETEKK